MLAAGKLILKSQNAKVQLELQAKQNTSVGGGDVFGYSQGWKVADGGSGTTWGPGDPGGPDNTPVDEWIHLAMTWNAQGDVTVYANGVAGTTNVFGGSFTANPGNIEWEIASSVAEGFKGLDGELADFALYDIALTTEQIGAIKDNGVSSGLTGDFDGDGDVDGADFLKWQRELGDAANLTLWQDNFGTTAAAATAASVPEPASWILICTMTLATARWRRRC